MENSEDESKKEEQFRKYLYHYLTHTQDLLETNREYHNKLYINLKAWTITLFMVSVGFCLQYGFDDYKHKFLFWIIPFIPVLIFWFNYAFREYLNEQYKSDTREKQINDIFKNLYKYSFKELNERAEKVIPVKYDWYEKGKRKWKRFICKLIYYVPDKAISFENLSFFGMMFLIWLLICLWRFNEFFCPISNEFICTVIIFISSLFILLILFMLIVYGIGAYLDKKWFGKNNKKEEMKELVELLIEMREDQMEKFEIVIKVIKENDEKRFSEIKNIYK